MSFAKFFPISLFIAAQAAIMMIIEPRLKFVSWISFQAWAMYFLAGCNIKMGIKTFVGYFMGIVASVAIMEGAGFFGGMGIGSATVPANLWLSVFAVVVLVICSEKVPGIDFIPAWFIGAGVFFGLMNLDNFPDTAKQIDKYIQSSGKLMWSAAMGLFFGYVTVTFRTWYEKKFMPKKEESSDVSEENPA